MRKEFLALIKSDLEDNNLEATKAWEMLGNLNGARKNSEIWAELFAHASGEELSFPTAGDDLAVAIRRGFPKCFEHIQKFRRDFADI